MIDFNDLVRMVVICPQCKGKWDPYLGHGCVHCDNLSIVPKCLKCGSPMLWHMYYYCCEECDNG